MRMLFNLIVLLAFMVGCGTTPKKTEPPKPGPEPTEGEWYQPKVGTTFSIQISDSERKNLDLEKKVDAYEFDLWVPKDIVSEMQLKGKK